MSFFKIAEIFWNKNWDRFFPLLCQTSLSYPIELQKTQRPGAKMASAKARWGEAGERDEAAAIPEDSRGHDVMTRIWNNEDWNLWTSARTRGSLQESLVGKSSHSPPASPPAVAAQLPAREARQRRPRSTPEKIIVAEGRPPERPRY